jgi:hypothetical protein
VVGVQQQSPAERAPAALAAQQVPGPGIVNLAFGQLGLGIQYELPDSVANLIQNGFLKPAEDG